MSEGTDRGTSVPPPASSGLDPAAEALCTSFHVALDTMDARRLRVDPDVVSIPGFVLLDTGDYEPVLALVPLHLFWRMQGMDILAHTRAANRERQARPRRLPVSGSVWIVDAKLDEPFKGRHGNASERAPTSPSVPCLRIGAVHALDRVTIEPGGPRYIESIDTRTMLPRFAETA